MATGITSQGDHGDSLEPMDMDILEEENLVETGSSNADTEFDMVIGHIEDIIMEEDFHQLREQFMDKYYLEFEDSEENKFVYTDIHKEYVDLVEKYLETELLKRKPDFSMIEFQRKLVEMKDELEGEVFEMLLTFSDFISFKEMFIDYRAQKEGKTVDFSDGFTVTSLSIG